MGQNEPNNYSEFIYRVGGFFLLVGIGLVVLFFLSEVAQKTAFSYFCWGTVLLIVGIMFRKQYKRAIPPSGRFSLLKRFRSKPKDKK